MNLYIVAGKQKEDKTTPMTAQKNKKLWKKTKNQSMSFFSQRENQTEKMVVITMMIIWIESTIFW